MDVVPVEDEASWTHPPFEGVVDGGFVWGRGALDDKLALVGIFEAVESLVTAGFAPDRTIYLALRSGRGDLRQARRWAHRRAPPGTGRRRGARARRRRCHHPRGRRGREQPHRCDRDCREGLSHARPPRGAPGRALVVPPIGERAHRHRARHRPPPGSADARAPRRGHRAVDRVHHSRTDLRHEARAIQSVDHAAPRDEHPREQACDERGHPHDDRRDHDEGGREGQCDPGERVRHGQLPAPRGRLGRGRDRARQDRHRRYARRRDPTRGRARGKRGVEHRRARLRSRSARDPRGRRRHVGDADQQLWRDGRPQVPR